MQLKTKKIIAREGLIALGVVLIALGTAVVGDSVGKMNYSLGMGLEAIGQTIVIFVYPLYIVTRFVVWAMRTLKQKG